MFLLPLTLISNFSTPTLHLTSKKIKVHLFSANLTFVYIASSQLCRRGTEYKVDILVSSCAQLCLQCVISIDFTNYFYHICLRYSKSKVVNIHCVYMIINVVCCMSGIPSVQKMSIIQIWYCTL